ncbi:MAG: hypothetical protein LBB51_00215 [Zoogloeaceae bacterium]|jgi:hypothetical protein|nr:hypothetical protein [Zoogloeaceae bacterium]
MADPLKVALELKFDVKGENVNNFVRQFDEKLRTLGNPEQGIYREGAIFLPDKGGSRGG